MSLLSSHAKYRFYELLPATFSVGTILACALTGFFAPRAAMYVVILFDLYWFMRIGYLAVYLTQSWSTFRRNAKINWLDVLRATPGHEDYWHLIFVPTYKEPLSVLTETFESFVACAYDHKKFIIVLAGEERDREHFEKNAAALVERYGGVFGKIIVTLHPKDTVGEIAGKGSNLHHAGQETKIVLDEMGIPYDKIVVSTFDCDTQPHPHYFAYLAKTFIDTPDRLHCSFQPIPVYNNNFWESTPLTRVVANGTTFWLLTDLSRPERLLTFSSHSMSWQALVDVGFWQPDIVTEDTRIFLQCWLYYKGNYRTVPLYITVSMSTVDVPNLWRTLVNQYKQIRRWGWGVEHLPYLLWNLPRNPEIPRGKKLRYLWNIAEGMYSWATVPIVIVMLGYVPFAVTDPTSSQLFLSQATPVVLSWLMRFSLVGLAIIMVYSWYLLPPRPKHVSKWHIGLFFLQWAFVPISLIFFGSIPALEAQIRLFLGKYLGFWVSEKAVASELSKGK